MSKGISYSASANRSIKSPKPNEPLLRYGPIKTDLPGHSKHPEQMDAILTKLVPNRVTATYYVWRKIETAQLDSPQSLETIKTYNH
jgi:hypothetical protein